MDGRIFLALAALISAGLFLNGLDLARVTANPFAGKRLLGVPIEGSDLSVERVRLIGRAQMIAAPLFLLFFAALSFGLFGPVHGINTIKLP